MWRPDFPFVERVEARLLGAHRALCVYSFVHRGTPERPGLVLGLDHGGACRGIAYRVAAAERSATIVYLRAREQVTSVYRECVRPIRLASDPPRACRRSATWSIAATCNMPAGCRSEQQLHHVRQGHGRSGANRDYVIETVRVARAARLSRDRAARARGAAGRDARGRRDRADRTGAAHCADGAAAHVLTPAAASSLSPAATSRAVASSTSRCSRSKKRLLVETGRNRIEHLDPDRAGIAEDRAARPEQSGVQRDRNARDAGRRHRDAPRRTCISARHRAADASPPER